MKKSFAALLLALALPFVARAEEAPPPPPPPRGVVAEVPAELANEVAEHSDVRLSKSGTASTTGTAAEINAGTASWSTGVYGYDGAGNITRIGAENFVYDGVNRLKSGQVSTGAAIATQSYTYDTYGNIKSVATSPALATDRAISVNAATNRLSDAGYTYGDAGNLTAGAGMNYVWDGVEMVTRRYEVGGQDERYLYTADDERIAVFKRHNNTSMRTVRGLNKQVLRDLAGSGAIGSESLSLRKDYIYRGTQLLASEGSDGTRHYRLDHLGSPRLITNASGLKTAFHTYYPFGIEATSASQDTESHKFTGHERDRDSGGNRDVDYMHARYYAVPSGKFISVDPGHDVRLRDPQTWNSYQYARNNPVLKTDPDGQAAQVLGGLIGAVVGIYAAGVVETMKVIDGQPATFDQTVRAVAAGAVGGAVAGAIGSTCPTCAIATRGARPVGLLISGVGGSIAGGATNKVIAGKRPSVSAAQSDAIAGAAGVVGGQVLAKVGATVAKPVVQRLSMKAAALRAEASNTNAGLGADKAMQQAKNAIDRSVNAAAAAGGEATDELVNVSLPEKD